MHLLLLCEVCYWDMCHFMLLLVNLVARPNFSILYEIGNENSGLERPECLGIDATKLSFTLAKKVTVVIPTFR